MLPIFWWMLGVGVTAALLLLVHLYLKMRRQGDTPYEALRTLLYEVPVSIAYITLIYFIAWVLNAVFCCIGLILSLVVWIARGFRSLFVRKTK